MRNWYQRGSANAICDVCGEKYKLSQLKKRWDGLWVCHKDYEERHPQDFLRARKESLHLPITKPRPQDTYVQMCTVFSKIAVAGLAVPGCVLAGDLTNLPLYASPNPAPVVVPNTNIAVTIADNTVNTDVSGGVSATYYRSITEDVTSSEELSESTTYYGAIAHIAVAGYSLSGAI